MIGAIAGDVIGSVYEGGRAETKAFTLFGEQCQFTDDTVCTLAIADALMSDGDFAGKLRSYFQAYPDRGFGGFFRQWAMGLREDYESWGNGSAMRISPVGHLARDEAEAMTLAKQASAMTHGHPYAVAGAQAVAVAMVMARHGADAEAIRASIADRFGYDLSRTVEALRPTHGFDVSCAGTVPVALICALETSDYEDTVRNAVWLGGDSDTIACIAGGLAETLFGVPSTIAERARSYLTPDLLDVLDRFERHVGAR